MSSPANQIHDDSKHLHIWTPPTENTKNKISMVNFMIYLTIRQTENTKHKRIDESRF